MLKTFIRFEPVDYCLESNEEIIDAEIYVDHCETYFDTNSIAKPGDAVAFIVDKIQYNLFINAEHLKASLTQGGIVVQMDIAVSADAPNQLYFTCILPDDIPDGSYEITIYKDYVLDVINFIPETTTGACDASFTVEVKDSPALEFEFSLDGINWSTGLFTGKCMQQYVIYVREQGDTNCISGSLNFDALPISCGAYKGFTLQQIIDLGISINRLYNCEIEDLKP